jgi:thiol-disulfide isomerase/thioredoxin
MKSKLFLLFLTFSLVLIGCKDKSIQISGKLKNPIIGEYIYLDELKANFLDPVDSSLLSSDGSFTFTRDIDYPTYYILKINNNDFFTLLASPGDKINISAEYGSLNDPENVTGSKETEKLVEYNKALKNTITKLNGLNEIYMQNENSPDLPQVIQTLDSTAQTYLDEINAYTKQYIDENINSMAALMALYQQVAPQVYVLNPVDDIEYFIRVDSSLYSRYPESLPVLTLHDQVLALMNRISMNKGTDSFMGTGNVVPEIELPSPDGQMIKLSSTRGKIVLLDFWASWCAPCRKENPNLVRAYNMYKNKGFQIFQVSLDKTKEDWLRGIKQDNLGQWIHVSDLKYWNSVVVPMYKIESIPYNLLLDKDGRVIASNLRGSKLMQKLSEVIE